MDITSHSFQFYLQKVLDDLATCCFVAIDLEFSGVPKAQNGPRAKLQTLQERYTETRSAAERYQILQIGLTICDEDTEKGEIAEVRIGRLKIQLRSIVHLEAVQYLSESNC